MQNIFINQIKSIGKVNWIIHKDFRSFQTKFFDDNFILFNVNGFPNFKISLLVTYFQNLGSNYY